MDLQVPDPHSVKNRGERLVAVLFCGSWAWTKTRMIKRGSCFKQQLPDLTKSGSIVVSCNYRWKFCKWPNLFPFLHFEVRRYYAFMRISEMGAAMFIMHVDRHFPIWTTYSCSFRQTCPKKSEKIPYTDIYLGISMVELCRGVWMFKNVYYFSMHRGDTQITLRWLQPVRRNVCHLDAKNAIFTHHRGSTGGAQGPADGDPIGGEVFNSTEGVWMGFSSRCLWRCCLVVLHPRWCKISSIQQYLDINKHQRPFHQGTRTGVPLTVYLWYLAGVLGWNSWGWP